MLACVKSAYFCSHRNNVIRVFYYVICCLLFVAAACKKSPTHPHMHTHVFVHTHACMQTFTHTSTWYFVWHLRFPIEHTSPWMWKWNVYPEYHDQWVLLQSITYHKTRILYMYYVRHLSHSGKPRYSGSHALNEVRGSYRKSWATIFCKVTCFIIDKPNTPP